MFTRDFSIFEKMVKISQDQKLDYKILCSYHKRKATNDFTESYKLLLCTNLYSVLYEKEFSPDNTHTIQNFLAQNHDCCVDLDFDITYNTKNDSSKLELHSFR
jgi:hypothetical protein